MIVFVMRRRIDDDPDVAPGSVDSNWFVSNHTSPIQCSNCDHGRREVSQEVQMAPGEDLNKV